MRDIALEPLPDDPAALPSPYVGDDAFTRKPPGGINAGVGLTDPSFASDKAYVMPSVGGEFGPGRSVLVSGYADGGQAKLAADPVMNPPAAPIAKPAYAMTGRSNNQTTRLNLYPWFKSPRQGLDQNNVTVGAGMELATEEAKTEEPVEESTESEKDDRSAIRRAFGRKPAAKHK